MSTWKLSQGMGNHWTHLIFFFFFLSHSWITVLKFQMSCLEIIILYSVFCVCFREETKFNFCQSIFNPFVVLKSLPGDIILAGSTFSLFFFFKYIFPPFDYFHFCTSTYLKLVSCRQCKAVIYFAPILQSLPFNQHVKLCWHY